MRIKQRIRCESWFEGAVYNGIATAEAVELTASWGAEEGVAGRVNMSCNVAGAVSKFKKL